MTNKMQHTDRNVSAKHMTRIEGWASRKPCIALMGEFSAGKTTLINFLLGEDVLPTRVTATQLPPVWMSYGDESAHYMDETGRRHDIDQAELHQVPVNGVRYIRLFSKSTLLETMDLLDTPGISDPNIPRQTWEIAAGYVNAVIWCTHATQAWRESERSAWDSLPDRLRPFSVLLATRSDKLSAHDRGRVIARLKREAGASFRTILPFSAVDAIKACAEGEAGDLWLSSGAQDLLQNLNEIAEAICANRKGLLERYSVVEDQEDLRDQPKPKRREAATKIESTQDHADLRLTSATIHDMIPRRDDTADTDGTQSDGSRVLPSRIARPGAGDSDQRRARLSREAADTMVLRVVQPDERDDAGGVGLDQSPLAATAPLMELDYQATITPIEPLMLRNRLPKAEPGIPAQPIMEDAVEDAISEQMDALAFDGDQDVLSATFEFETEADVEDDSDDEMIISDDQPLFADRSADMAADYDADMPDEAQTLDVGLLMQNIARESDADVAKEQQADGRLSVVRAEGGTLDLWRAVVARAPQPETVPDMLAIIEGFLSELDARGGLRIHSAA